MPISDSNLLLILFPTSHCERASNFEVIRLSDLKVRPMNARSDVSACANPECKSKFTHLGDGELFVFHVEDPSKWGVSSHSKQKVFWLCDNCCEKFYVRLDRRNHSAHLVHRGEATRVVA